MCDSRFNFYNLVAEKIRNKSQNLLVVTDPESGFYELCQKFLDIALNAQKMKGEDGRLQGLFLHSDIGKAQEATVQFIKKHKINDTEDLTELLDLIEDVYSDSKADNESRQISGFDKSEQSNQVIGFVGTYYIFTIIPDDVFATIKSKIVELIKNIG